MAETRETELDAGTRYCAVLGHPIRHSASPAMHNAALRTLGLNWRYLAFDVHPDDLPAALAGFRAQKILGLNLTVPHKLLAVNLVDDLDDSARRWGAVNTIRFEAPGSDGTPRGLAETDPETAGEIRMRGFNTDADAITRTLKEDLGFEPEGASAVVLGAGGAGQTAALKLAEDGVKRLWLVNRTRAKAEAVAAETRRRHPDLAVDLGYPEQDTADLLLNATSLGLRETDPLPWDERELPLDRVGRVFDMIYRPAETPLLRAARESGRSAANGLGMLLYQGARALEIWTGKPAPEAVMREALEKHVYGRG